MLHYGLELQKTQTPPPLHLLQNTKLSLQILKETSINNPKLYSTLIVLSNERIWYGIRSALSTTLSQKYTTKAIEEIQTFINKNDPIF